MEEITLTWFQGLQLIALGPCFFMVFFLCFVVRRFSQIVVPLLYFFSLIAGFSLPIVEGLDAPQNLQGFLMLIESATPAISFLLIYEFLHQRIPPWPYWLILAIPVIGGGGLVYVTLLSREELCITIEVCGRPVVFKELYQILSAAVTFLFTLVVLEPTRFREHDDSDHDRKNKYALIIALILLNLTMLAINLAALAKGIDHERALIAETFVRMGFIYLVLTSLFRVFDRAVGITYENIPSLKPLEPVDKDLKIADEIRHLMTEDKYYRTMVLTRETLAKKLAVTPHYLSHVINLCFKQNLNALVNHYRVEEAKQRLATESSTITVIAFEVGFSSIPSFNRVFKAETGLSPTEYRKQHFNGTPDASAEPAE